jgi:hypothetical protein
VVWFYWLDGERTPAFADTEARVKALAKEHADEGVYVVDPDGQEWVWNRHHGDWERL